MPARSEVISKVRIVYDLELCKFDVASEGIVLYILHVKLVVETQFLDRSYAVTHNLIVDENIELDWNRLI